MIVSRSALSALWTNRGSLRGPLDAAHQMILIATALAVIGCAPASPRPPDRSSDAQAMPGPEAAAVAHVSVASDYRIVRLAMAADVDENSASAASVARPGILYTINDSGHDPALFAFDTTGADRGRWRIEGAINRDWEAVAVGRCAPNSRRLVRLHRRRGRQRDAPCAGVDLPGRGTRSARGG